jgi:hypothetical protein
MHRRTLLARGLSAASLLGASSAGFPLTSLARAGDGWGSSAWTSAEIAMGDTLMVSAEVAGSPVRAILDSGSAASIINTRLVESLDKPRRLAHRLQSHWDRRRRLLRQTLGQIYGESASTGDFEKPLGGKVSSEGCPAGVPARLSCTLIHSFASLVGRLRVLEFGFVKKESEMAHHGTINIWVVFVF